jgi:hypothetical protein
MHESPLWAAAVGQAVEAISSATGMMGTLQQKYQLPTKYFFQQYCSRST